MKTPFSFPKKWSPLALLLASALCVALALASIASGPLQAQETPAAPAVAESVAAPAAPAAEEKPIEITCSGESSFDTVASMAVFVKDVKVVSPQFTLSADKLTVYLKKEEPGAGKGDKKSGGKPVAKTEGGEAASAGASEGKAPDATSGLDRVIAEGNVVITQDCKDPASGKVTRSIGKAARVDFSDATGDAVLTGWPQLQQGENHLVATAESTVMILNRDGKLRNKGPCTTIFKPEKKEGENKAAPSSSSASSAAPAAATGDAQPAAAATSQSAAAATSSAATPATSEAPAKPASTPAPKATPAKRVAPLFRRP